MKEDYIEMLEEYLKLDLGDDQVLGLNSFAVNNILNIIKNSDKVINELLSRIAILEREVEKYEGF